MTKEQEYNRLVELENLANKGRKLYLSTKSSGEVDCATTRYAMELIDKYKFPGLLPAYIELKCLIHSIRMRLLDLMEGGKTNMTNYIEIRNLL